MEASSYEQIGDDHEGHGFHHCNGSRAENRVVPSFDEQRLLLVRGEVQRVLHLRNAGRWFERHPYLHRCTR